MAESGGVSEARIAGNAFRQPDAVLDREVLEKLFGPLVNVEQPQLQVEHRLAGHAEEKVPRLDDPGMHGADRHLEDTFAFDKAEFVPLALEWGQSGAQVKVLPQRVY